MDKATRNGQRIPKPKPDGYGARHVQYILLFTGMTICFGMRTIMNVAVVQMLAKKEENKTYSYPTYPEWSSSKNIMLSSFFWGYITLNVLAGQMAKLYGPRYFLSTAICITSIFCSLLPLFAEHVGLFGVIACRIIQGMTQGFLFPSCHHLMSKWTTPLERAKWATFVYSGSSLGNVISMPVTGVICASDLGWPAIFYIYGALGVTWSIFVFFFIANAPSTHGRISVEERAWLEDNEALGKSEEKIVTPWTKILTSPPFISIVLVQIGLAYGYYTILTEISSYMVQILHFDIKSNSLLSALPYLALWILSMVISPFVDILIRKELTSVELSRKIFCAVATFGSSLSLIVLILVGAANQGVVVFVMVAAVCFNAFQYGGHGVNHIDLSPIHAGTLMGIGNGLSNVGSISAPLAVDVVKALFGYEETDIELWNIVFGIAAFNIAAVGIVYVIFGKGEVQPWNYPEGYKEKESMQALSMRQSQKLSVTWVS